MAEQKGLKRRKFPIIASSYNKSNTQCTGTENLVNMYLEQKPDSSNYFPVVAVGTPGTSLWLDCGGSSVRGMLRYTDHFYAVVDDTLYKIEWPGVKTAVGTLTTTTGRVTIKAILGQLELADGANVYNYNVGTNTFTTLTDPSTPANCKQVLALNSKFILFQPNSQTLWVTDLADGTSITATHFFNSNSSYDIAVSGAVNTNLMYIFNEFSTDVWEDTGQVTVPFTKVSGGNFSIGCAAEYSPLVVNNATYFLAQNESGVLGIGSISGLNMQIVSNHAFAERIRNFASYDDAFAWTDTIDGHIMYNITFPTSNVARGETWGYDTTTGVFFQRTTYYPGADFYPDYDRHIANCNVSIQGIQLIGDYNSGKIYKLDPEAYTDNGQPIHREITSPTLVFSNQFFKMGKLEIDVEKGVGLVSGQGSSPLIFLEVSRDKGNTWTNKISRTAAAMGDYTSRFRWASLGGGRAMTLRLTMSDPVQWVVCGATVEVSVGQLTDTSMFRDGRDG